MDTMPQPFIVNVATELSCPRCGREYTYAEHPMKPGVPMTMLCDCDKPIQAASKGEE